MTATSEKDIDAKEKLLSLLKSKMKFSNEQIAKIKYRMHKRKRSS